MAPEGTACTESLPDDHGDPSRRVSRRRSGRDPVQLERSSASSSSPPSHSRRWERSPRAFPYPQIGLTAIVIAGFAAWLAIDRRQLASARIVPFVTRTAIAVLVIICALAVLQPAVVPELTVAAILPAVIVLPYLDDRPLRWFIGVTWLAGMFIVVVGRVVPETAPLPVALAFALQLASMGLVFGVVLFLVCSSAAASGAAHELGSLAAPSSDSPRRWIRSGSATSWPSTLRSRPAPPSRASATDRAGDRVLTYGYYPGGGDPRSTSPTHCPSTRPPAGPRHRRRAAGLDRRPGG
jgi:hypothetical protein